MNDERLAELQEKYKDRNLLEELAWGVYANHSGYTSKQNGEFLNWLCMKAYKALKERPAGEWIDHSEDEGYVECSFCHELTNCEGNIEELHYCWNCGAAMRKKDEQ